MASSVNLDTSDVLNITCRKGDTFSITITLKNSAGTLLTLLTSEYAFLMQVKSKSINKRGRMSTSSLILGTPNVPQKADDLNSRISRGELKVKRGATYPFDWEDVFVGLDRQSGMGDLYAGILSGGLQLKPGATEPYDWGDVLGPNHIKSGSSQGSGLFETPTLDDVGNITIEASAETMSKVPSGSYSYDLQYMLPSSTGLDTHKTVLRGKFTVNPDITEAFEK